MTLQLPSPSCFPVLGAVLDKTLAVGAVGAMKGQRLNPFPSSRAVSARWSTCVEVQRDALPVLFVGARLAIEERDVVTSLSTSGFAVDEDRVVGESFPVPWVFPLAAHGSWNSRSWWFDRSATNLKNAGTFQTKSQSYNTNERAFFWPRCASHP